MRQTWILITIPILFPIGMTIMFSSLWYIILMLSICKKYFISTIFLRIKVHPWNETNLDTYDNLNSFSYWHYNHVLHIWVRYIDALDLKEKFSFRHFPCDQSLPVKWDKLGYSHTNLHSFCYWHNNHVLPIRIHDIDALDLREKLFFPPFSL